MTRSRLFIALIALVILGLVATALVIAAIPDPAPTSPALIASPEALSAADRRFYQRLVPELRSAAAEARALTTLGQERSRDLIAIRTGQTRLQGHLDALDKLLAPATVPDRFSGVATAYAPAATAVREAMSAAESAFLRFDWDAVGVATDQMAAGTAQLEATASRLDAAAGATPSASPTEDSGTTT